MSGRLTGKPALVTGAVPALGAAIARRHFRRKD
jgi:NAD(P)-dependent dehydrogenase (short-subunit alcohol dehydrogenase family)